VSITASHARGLDHPAHIARSLSTNFARRGHVAAAEQHLQLAKARGDVGSRNAR